MIQGQTLIGYQDAHVQARSAWHIFSIVIDKRNTIHAYREILIEVHLKSLCMIMKNLTNHVQANTIYNTYRFLVCTIY